MSEDRLLEVRLCGTFQHVMDNRANPPYATPPPWNPLPPRYSRSGSGRFWIFSTIVLAGLVLLLVMGDLLQYAGGWPLGAKAGRQSGRLLEELTVENNGSAHKIAVIDVEGMISSQSWDRSGRSMVDFIEDQLNFAAGDSAVEAVILKVDSPGGEVMASDDISRAILDFQEEHSKPVVAAMGGLAASGGYYVSAPCQWIVANELTLTGSIGVIMHSLNYRGLLDKVGLHPLVFKSGKFKDMLSGTKKVEDIDPEERRMIQELIDDTYQKFVSVVRSGRTRAKEKNGETGRALVENWEGFADGRILTGKQAYENGFVDETGNFDTAVERAKKLAGITDANLVRYQEPFSFSQIFSPFVAARKSNLVTVDMGLDMPKLEAGRLYFLSASVLH